MSPVDSLPGVPRDIEDGAIATTNLIGHDRIASMARDVRMAETFRGVAPFFLAQFVRVGLRLAAPGLVLWLPRLMTG